MGEENIEFAPTIGGLFSGLLHRIGMNFLPAGKNTYYYKNGEASIQEVEGENSEENRESVKEQGVMNSSEYDRKRDAIKKEFKKRHSKENIQYFHPVKGVLMRMQNSNPGITTGLNRTVIPAAEGALAVTGIPSLLKQFVATPVTTTAAVVTGSATGALGYRTGKYLDSKLNTDGFFSNIGGTAAGLAGPIAARRGISYIYNKNLPKFDVKVPEGTRVELGDLSEEAILNSQYGKDLLKQFGLEKTKEIIKVMQSPEFIDYIYAGGKDFAQQEMKDYAIAKEIINKIGGNPDLNRAALAGSLSVASEGTINRGSAVPHDIDVNAYVYGANKADPSIITEDSYTIQGLKDEHSPLGYFYNIQRSPILSHIRWQYPETHANAQVQYERPTWYQKLLFNLPTNKTIQEKLPDGVFKDIILNGKKELWRYSGKIKELSDPLYDEGVFKLSPQVNTAQGITRSRLIRTRLNGQPIDIFLGDTRIPYNKNFQEYTGSQTALEYKKLWQRPKDVSDLEVFAEYSQDNPILNIDNGTLLNAQYAPPFFKSNQLLTPEGYPVIQFIETYPGSGVKVPVWMNHQGLFKLPWQL